MVCLRRRNTVLLLLLLLLVVGPPPRLCCGADGGGSGERRWRSWWWSICYWPRKRMMSLEVASPLEEEAEEGDAQNRVWVEGRCVLLSEAAGV